MCVVYLNWPKLLYNMCMQGCGIKRMLASQTQHKNPSGFLVVFYHFHISALFPSVCSPALALLLLAADKSSDDWVFQRHFFSQVFETVTWTSESMSDWFTKLANRFADIASLNRFLDKTLSLESFKRFFFLLSSKYFQLTTMKRNVIHSRCVLSDLAAVDRPSPSRDEADTLNLYGG